MPRGLSSRSSSIAALALALLSFAACGSDAEDKAAAGGAGAAQAKSDETYRIGVSMYSQLQPRWQFDVRAIEQEAKKNGDEVLVEYANSDPQKQTRDVEALLSRDIDVLVIAATDVKVGGSLIEKAKREGVKTIAYDIGVQGGVPDWFIVRPQEQVAELQIAAAKRAKPRGNYAVIRGDAGNDLAQATSKVYERELQAPGIDVVYSDWTPDYDPKTALRTAEDVLTKNSDRLDAFVVTNDGMATGVIQALRGRGLAGDVFVSGLDGDKANLRLIATGDQTMTVWTPIDQMGREAATAAHQLAAGEKPAADGTTKNDAGAVPTRFVNLTEINRDNLCDFLTSKAPEGWATVDEVFSGDTAACR